MPPTHNLPLVDSDHHASGCGCGQEHATASPQPQARSGCDCHDEQTAAPELDARMIPHAIRHGAILGALGSLPTGAAMVLVAPHDPQPLIAQIAQLEGEAVSVSYLQRGPEVWKLQLSRVG